MRSCFDFPNSLVDGVDEFLLVQVANNVERISGSHIKILELGFWIKSKSALRLTTDCLEHMRWYMGLQRLRTIRVPELIVPMPNMLSAREYCVESRIEQPGDDETIAAPTATAVESRSVTYAISAAAAKS